MMLFRPLVFLPVFAALMGVGGAFADTAKPPVVVELFTSQGCFSCPPAEAFLGKLAARPDVVALEFHVDYWDELVYGFAGKWKDPFSSASHTSRQRAYNVRIRGRGGVYTPQMVVGGKLEAVGSHEGKVETAIRKARKSAAIRIKVRPISGGRLEARISGSAKRSSIWLVTFLRSTKTEVRSGENKGKSLTSHNVVTKLRRVGTWNGTSTHIDLGSAPRKAGHSCAVLIQQGSDGPILGAAYCPGAST